MRYNISNQNRYLSYWLFAMCVAIICMIFIGGLTRLTDSGLSITEWKPVSGILPPLNETEWVDEFDKYKKSPEYIAYNSGMSIDDFKFIYLLEFYHRIAGRVTGLLYFIPLVFFLSCGMIKLKESGIYIAALLLLACQGFMGWYMVKSGLISDPHVSHYRLAAHLMLAISLYMIMFWQLMKNYFDPILFPRSLSIKKQKFLCALSIILLLIQIIMGAFVAGLDAGLIYNSFPLMDGKIIPEGMLISGFSLEIFSNPVFVQFLHRNIAYLLFLVITIFCFSALKLKNNKFSMAVFWVSIALILQVFLGIATLIYAVPIALGLMHQLGAILLLSCLLWAYFLLEK